MEERERGPMEQLEQKPFSTEEARQLLNKERQQMLALCQAAVQRALQEHGCELVAVARITPDGRVEAVARLRVSEAG